MDPVILSSSILSADFAHLADQVKQAEESSVDWIHVDVMDGQFVPNITMGPFIVETCRRITTLPIDVHLMIEHPQNHIEAFANAGANLISVHIEGNPNIHRTLQALKQLNVQPGIVLNPGTPVGAIEGVASLVDFVLVMTVNPGYSGQKFLPESLEKIQQVRQMLDRKNPQARIEVDGGVSSENISALYHAGARCFVAATSIFRYPLGISAGIRALREAIV